MPFQPMMIFAAGYATATTAVLHGVQTNLPITVTFQGTSTEDDGLYAFEFHAEGNTPSGAPFVRDQSRCSFLARDVSTGHSSSQLGTHASPLHKNL